MQHWLPSPDAPIADLTKFTPVPRKYRYDGWTAERQRTFIAELAQTGSVKAAAQRISMSSEGAYYLRRQPGAESFRAAWNAALDSGVQRLTDIAIDRAVDERWLDHAPSMIEDRPGDDPTHRSPCPSST